MSFCSNCGKQLAEGVKFCSECGAKVIESENPEQRKVVYEGEIHKCPSCGEILESFVAKCPTCGYELRGKKSSNSVKEFAMKLAATEMDSAKVVLIQNFPIPNTKEDIFEFMILAASNFEEYYSDSGDRQKEISKAWVSKIKQGYQKAKILFGGDQDFLKIQKIYDQICNKINVSVKKDKRNTLLNLVLRTIGLWGGLIIFIMAFFIDIFSYSDTSIYHLGGGAIMIIGAFMIGRKKKEVIDAGIGIACGILAIVLGTILQSVFYGNGSAMELAGGATIIVTVVRMVQSFVKKD